MVRGSQWGALRPITGTVAASVLLLGAFLIDCASGNEVSSSLFYVVGIGVAAWLVGRRLGIAFAFLSTAAWGLAVRVVGPGFSRPSVFYWNLAVELAIYLTIAVSLDGIQRGRMQEQALLRQLSLTNDLLDHETQAVGDLQREMLPPGPPRMEGYEWQVHYATSTHAGGDFYDFFPLGERSTGILVGDASGHGAPATVLMAMIRALMHTQGDGAGPPDQVLQRLGQQLSRIVPAGRFATASYAVLEGSEGSLAFSLAGHPPPLLVRGRDGAIEELPLCGGPPLGIPVERPFESGSEVLHPGDTLVFYTDGLTEGMNPMRELFGVERLSGALAGGNALPLADLLDRVLVHWDDHCAGAAIEDDLTLLMLRRTPYASAGPPHSSHSPPRSARARV